MDYFLFIKRFKKELYLQIESLVDREKYKQPLEKLREVFMTEEESKENEVVMVMSGRKVQ